MSRPAKLRTGVGAAVLAACGLFAQSEDLPTFEVASVRLHDTASFGPNTVIGPERFAMRVTAKSLVEWAYDLPFYQIDGGPEWFGARRNQYDIQAKING